MFWLLLTAAGATTERIYRILMFCPPELGRWGGYGGRGAVADGFIRKRGRVGDQIGRAAACCQPETEADRHQPRTAIETQ
jgi:hypothetical protein